jgi:glycerol-3-phosphate dehydrogenase
MNHRMVDTVINRCKMPDDGDILVPAHTVAVIGTTDRHVPDPDVYGIDADEVELMMVEGEKLVPGFTRYRALRAWAGVRPLYKDQDVADDRDISRTYKLLDHGVRNGVEGFISIVGGKWTTYRLMAAEAVDEIARKLHVDKPCRTANELLPHNLSGKHHWKGERLRAVEDQQIYGDLICECELVTRRDVQEAIDAGIANIDDIRRDTRLGMGPCQGGWCIYRCAGMLQEQRSTPSDLRFGRPSNKEDEPEFSVNHANAALLHFLQARWKGVTPVLWGDQLRQARLDELIYANVLGVQRLRPLSEQGGGLVTDHPLVATEYVKA